MHHCSAYAGPHLDDCISALLTVVLMLLQNLKTLDPSKLTPLTPEVISRQATINIGGASTRHSADCRHLCCCCAYGHYFNQALLAGLQSQAG